jgi:DNA-binding ferritin-like protein (Dps family)
MTDPTAPETPRTALGHAFVAAVEGYDVADAAGTDSMFFVDIMLGTLREQGFAIEREAGNTDALRAALLLLHEWREASLNDDAGALGTLTDATTDFIDGAALAASDAELAGIDVETLTAALVDAEDDDQMGPEYRPERLAEYLHDWLDRLSRESDR